MAPATLLLSLLVASPWTVLQPGLEYRAVSIVERPDYGDGVLHVVRIDPTRARVEAFAASREGGAALSAGKWCRSKKLAVAINAGMYATDHLTHVGYFRIDQHVNQASWESKYASFLVADDRGVRILDRGSLEAAGFDAYRWVAQNLRLIAGPGRNVWSRSGKRWSEAAVAQDEKGRILFLFSRSPLPMHELNRRLLASKLQIVRAQHMEGGPEASLSIHAGGVNLDLSGSYETGFVEDDGNQKQWPLPNVLGVQKEWAVSPEPGPR